jgi:hypothetical protein
MEATTSLQVLMCSSQSCCNCVGVLLVYYSPVETADLFLRSTICLQNSIFSEWAMLGSNQRPLPCEGSALPLS